MGIIKYQKRIKEEGSDLAKIYNRGITDLNKLKYSTNMGENHPGEPPIITRKIPTEPTSLPSPEPRNPITRRLDDVSRIAQLLVRKEGLKFISNNLALNTAPEVSYRQGPTLAGKTSALSLGNAANAILDTTLLLGSTLAQVGVAGTGTHFIRSFGNTYFVSKKLSYATAYQGQPGAVSVRYKVDQPFSYSNLLTVDNVNGAYPKSTEDADYKDYIKFYFEILQPEDLDNNGKLDKTILYFRAYLDSLNDNYNGNWNSFNYVGRGEQFYTYNSFTRNIQFSFKVAAATKIELMPIYTKLRHLVGSTAPSYSEGGFMRGTLSKVTIGDYIFKQPGFFSAINLTWNKEYPWEIAFYKDHEGREIAGEETDVNSDLKINQLPTVLDVSATFTPIHRFTPQSLRLDSSFGAGDGKNLFYINKSEGLGYAEGNYDDWVRDGRNE